MFFRLLSPTVATLELICTTFEERSTSMAEKRSSGTRCISTPASVSPAQPKAPAGGRAYAGASAGRAPRHVYLDARSISSRRVLLCRWRLLPFVGIWYPVGDA